MGLNDKKKPIGTAKSDKKNVVTYVSPKYGSTSQVDTSGYSSGAKRFGATMTYPAGSNSVRNSEPKVQREGAIKEFTTNRKGADRIIATSKGEPNKSILTLPLRGKAKTTYATPKVKPVTKKIK